MKQLMSPVGVGEKAVRRMFREEAPWDTEDMGGAGPDLDLYEQQLEAIFAPDGLLARHIANYEQRDQQLQLAKAIMASLKRERHLLAEAGTGIGKSFAYLIAASLWALQENKVVIISTNTIPLQSQLVEKDLPLVAAVMADLNLGELRYELAKGRANYLCKRRLEALLLRAQQEEVAHLDVARRLWELKDEVREGDRPSFPMAVPSELWQLIAGDAEDCHGSDSPYFDHCFIQQARRRLSSAHLIITNHAMFFSDLVMRRREGSGIFPSYDHVIFDEAHRIEDVFSSFFARQVTFSQVEMLFRMIRQKWQTWMEDVFDAETLAQLNPLEQKVRQQMLDALDAVGRDLFMPAKPPEEGREMAEDGPAWTVLLNKPLTMPARLEETLTELEQFFRRLLETKAQEEPQRRGLERLLQRAEGLKEDMRFILRQEGGGDWAHWAEWHVAAGEQLTDLFGQHIALVAQPINARAILPETLFAKVPVTLVSATLATDGDFSFISGRLGLDQYDAFIAPSPFDYQKNVLMVISEHAPFPNVPGQAYERFLVHGLQRVLRQSAGRTLVLFTSYKQMHAVAEKLAPWCTSQGRPLLVQEAGGERERLLDQFRREPKGVLFGAESFWEGIDLPGDELQCVVITKIPFANPSQPLTRARLDWIERSGGNPFDEYMVPLAILKTKQGFGRLIRRATDRGAVVFMDSRLVKKRYGRRILSGLPPVRMGKLQDIPAYVQGPDTDGVDAEG